MCSPHLNGPLALDEFDLTFRKNQRRDEKIAIIQIASEAVVFPWEYDQLLQQNNYDYYYNFVYLVTVPIFVQSYRNSCKRVAAFKNSYSQLIQSTWSQFQSKCNLNLWLQ